jgi:excinuclease ABC subunit C
LNSPILQSKNESFIEKVLNAPKLPGCYIYYNELNVPIYVGKAKILINRVKSYFNNFHKLDERIRLMIEESSSIDYFTVDSEVEALILENNLIKKYHPKYNIMMRDDKSYIYVRFQKVRKANQPYPTKTSSYQDFPTITLTRNKKDDGAEYFGPYPDTMPAKRILKKLRKLFPYCASSGGIYEDKETKEIINKNNKPCFYYHIGLCKGSCHGLEEKKDYQKRYLNIRKFFLGEKNELLRELESDMKIASKDLNFEKAAKLRDRIFDIKYVTANISIDKEVDDTVVYELKTKQRATALDQLIEKLQFPIDKLNLNNQFRIECYDISNIQGTNAVGSMVVMVNGEIRPDLYRRFKIRMKNEPNDFAMMQEVLTRRFRQFIFSNREESFEFDNLGLSDDLLKKAKGWKEDESFSQKPDLIIIDGGKGQLASAYRILYNFNLHNEIPIVGLAKKLEEIFKVTYQFKDEYFNQINDSANFTRVLLPRRSQALFLVQRIRDEAHRFAITYHRNLRSKKFIEKEK